MNFTLTLYSTLTLNIILKEFIFGDRFEQRIMLNYWLNLIGNLTLDGGRDHPTLLLSWLQEAVNKSV